MRNIKRTVSILYEKAQNEVFYEKLNYWGRITDSVVRNKQESYLKDLFFIKLFSDMPISVLHYLFEINKNGESDLVREYLRDNAKYFYDNYLVCLSLTEIYKGKVKLTELRKKIIDFIGDTYQKS